MVGAVGVGAVGRRGGKSGGRRGRAARSVGAGGRRGRSARKVGAGGSAPGGADPTFEADPIGRRLECRPKKRIILLNMNFSWGAQG